ncbi:MAG: hypothetical protein HOI47_10170 [Candidatus Scalindua sp.]|nr:hypothetical protein [Candidatus Scalindua sp.]MBT6045985.1 hypothetical protein [Candidatus Scalindua sp.]MBT6227009.1 hypothetical protein [Candidatus Scalindua sp.]MBT7210035.1 hypothetical protein [Candidatus Scalindua sp.]
MNSKIIRLIVTIFVVIGISSCIVRDDYEEIAKDADFSRNNNGYIYASKYSLNLKDFSIDKYDIQQRKWLPFKGAQLSASGQWDIQKSLFACLVKRQGSDTGYKIGIFNLPKFELTKEVEFINSNFPSPIESQSNAVLFRLSPDEEKLAILQLHSKTPVQEYGGNCFHVPDKYKLLILSINDGLILFESDGYYRGDTLAWATNSKGVYLSSFSNPKIFEPTESSNCVGRSTQGISYDDENIFTEDILFANIETGDSNKIIDAKSPMIFVTNDYIYYSSWKKFYVWNIFKYDLNKGSASLLGSVSSVRVKAISPDGEWLIGNYSKDIPSERFSLVINTHNLSDRRIFDDGMLERVVWEIK